jgi:hypothetical protein
MDNTGREGEEALFDIIRSPSPEHEPEDDDGSQYLNNSGEGCMIFDEDERIDEGDDNDVDEENVLQITKTGEVYLLYKPSGDHYMS